MSYKLIGKVKLVVEGGNGFTSEFAGDRHNPIMIPNELAEQLIDLAKNRSMDNAPSKPLSNHVVSTDADTVGVI